MHFEQQLLLPILIYPRLISFESNLGSGSARQGRRRERCQPWMAVCAAHLHEHSQNSAGTLGLISRKDFLLRFWSFKNEGLRQGMFCLLRDSAPFAGAKSPWVPAAF